MRKAVFALALSIVMAGLGGCATRPQPHAIVEIPANNGVTGWRAIASADDQARLDDLAGTWNKARAAVPPRLKSRMTAEGPLLDPSAALELPALPPGRYKCRLLRLGGRQGFASFKPDSCFVNGDTEKLWFTKETGANLPGGWVHPDTTTREILLGGMRGATAKAAPGYGDSPATDMVGVVERVAPFRWRLILPKAGQGALLDVYELVPLLETGGEAA